MMVIDVNEDPNVEDYFSSFTSWHYAVSGPEMMDHRNWESWWLPSAEWLPNGIGGDEESEEYFQFAISPDCSTCELTNNSTWETMPRGLICRCLCAASSPRRRSLTWCPRHMKNATRFRIMSSPRSGTMAGFVFASNRMSRTMRPRATPFPTRNWQNSKLVMMRI